MHLLENYSLMAGQKIGKPDIYEKFFPLPFDKYITFQPFSKFEIKNYDYWPDVLGLIYPILQQNNIQIVQIGKNCPALPYSYNTINETSVPQAAYLIKRGMAHFGADSFGVHIASAFDKKIVALYSNNFPHNVGPYWSKPENYALFSPDFSKKNPNFSEKENPKRINEIRPEQIAEAICNLLGLEFNYPYETIFVGPSYHNRLIETAADQVVDPKSLFIDSMIVRMDFHFDESILYNQLKTCPVSIITNKPINLGLLQTFRNNIIEILYLIEEDAEPEFIHAVVRMAIKYRLATRLSEEKLKPLKLKFMDYGFIDFLQHPDLPEIKGESKMFYKSNKLTLSKGKIFTSKVAFDQDQPIPNVDNNIKPIIDTPQFWEELEYFMLLKEK